MSVRNSMVGQKFCQFQRMCRQCEHKLCQFHQTSVFKKLEIIQGSLSNSRIESKSLFRSRSSLEVFLTKWINPTEIFHKTEDKLSGEQSFSRRFTNMAILALPLTESFPGGPSLHGEEAWRPEFVWIGESSSRTIFLDNPDFPTVLVLFEQLSESSDYIFSAIGVNSSYPSCGLRHHPSLDEPSSSLFQIHRLQLQNRLNQQKIIINYLLHDSVHTEGCTCFYTFSSNYQPNFFMISGNGRIYYLVQVNQNDCFCCFTSY